MPYQRVIDDDGFCTIDGFSDRLEPFTERFDHMVEHHNLHPTDLAAVISRVLMNRASEHVRQRRRLENEDHT
jgi:hypothetical protein